jgi:hypothetical protein
LAASNAAESALKRTILCNFILLFPQLLFISYFYLRYNEQFLRLLLL